jgi:hypothetical protein
MPPARVESCPLVPRKCEVRAACQKSRFQVDRVTLDLLTTSVFIALAIERGLGLVEYLEQSLSLR